MGQFTGIDQMFLRYPPEKFWKVQQPTSNQLCSRNRKQQDVGAGGPQLLGGWSGFSYTCLKSQGQFLKKCLVFPALGSCVYHIVVLAIGSTGCCLETQSFHLRHKSDLCRGSPRSKLHRFPEYRALLGFKLNNSISEKEYSHQLLRSPLCTSLFI